MVNMSPDLHITGDDRADALLSTDPNALLLGMVLDQQDKLEKAFAGPRLIADRMGGALDVTAIATMSEEDFIAICVGPPAVHRFPAAMARRLRQVCQLLADEYAGDAANLWRSATSGAQIRATIQSLPGFGEQKAKIFTALLGKQYGAGQAGWRDAAGDYGLDGFRSVADIVDADSLIKVRTTKSEAKAAAKAKSAGQKTG